MPHAYTEEQLVEQAAIAIFAALGWATTSALDEVPGPTSPLGRLTRADVVLAERLRRKLVELNPGLPPEAIAHAVDEVSRDRSAMSPAAANREVYGLLKEGVLAPIAKPDGSQSQERVQVIDWRNPAANEFLLVSQFSVTGALYTRRPDLIGFVNGLPLVVIELKKPGVAARSAFDENLTSYKSDVPALFTYNAFLIASNGTESRVGSVTADWERFFDWKRVEREDEPRRVSLEVMLRGTCDRGRLLDLVENFTLFSEHKSGLIKVLAQNHQFLGVNNAIAASLKARAAGHGRGGVFWQTQGSGKSFAMVFYAQKILRTVPGNWSFVVVTDRTELDNQIATTFKACGAVSQAEGDACHAESGAHLRALLSGNHRYVFTLVQKFQTPELLCDRADVVVLTDEAHRSQYDTLAVNMRAALPKALFLAFTGTPLIAGEERTREVFGDYVSIYDFQQSVEDGATVPLFYENRTPELKIVNPTLNDDIYALIEAAALDPEEEARLALELGRQYHLLTRDDRLETVARDVVRHFLDRGFQGKAMVISIDKATALRMYEKVRKQWAAETVRVEGLVKRPYTLPAPEQASAVKRLETLRSTDMALIVSPSQNEIAQMQALGLDIVPHRKRMNTEKLDDKFKDTADPLRLVFVCAMWLTGFDAPSCSTVYLDKPMRNHTLMQTIARANRVFPGKHSGVIVDYANVFESLEKALAIYGGGGGGGGPVKDKSELVEELEHAVNDAVAFCAEHSVDVPGIGELAALDRLLAVADAVDALITPDPRRKDFLAHERLVVTLYAAVKPDPAVITFAHRVACIATIADEIRNRLRPDPANISRIMGQVTVLLDASITDVTLASEGPPLVDLSKIDFEALARRIKASPHKNTDIETLKAAIRARLDRMIEENFTRTDYLDKFEELVESYNMGSRNIEQLLEELIRLGQNLTAEQERHVREGLTEPELVVFDILVRPAPELSEKERDEVKVVARALLARVRELLVLDWRRRVAARSQVSEAIKGVLDDGLPRVYTPEVYNEKCTALYEHFYEKYGGGGGGPWGATG